MRLARIKTGNDMLNIFYRKNGKIEVSQSENEFSKIILEDVVWIDLLSPTGPEKRAVEKFLGMEIQSRAQAEEIESSSRYFETDEAIFANTNFLTPGPEEYMMQAVSFTLVDDSLSEVLRSFRGVFKSIPSAILTGTAFLQRYSTSVSTSMRI